MSEERNIQVGDESQWFGSDNALPKGAVVKILAIDPECPDERGACWVRYWPEGRDFPKYRSLDMCDLSRDSRPTDADVANPDTLPPGITGVGGYFIATADVENSSETVKAFMAWVSGPRTFVVDGRKSDAQYAAEDQFAAWRAGAAWGRLERVKSMEVEVEMLRREIEEQKRQKQIWVDKWERLFHETDRD